MKDWLESVYSDGTDCTPLDDDHGILKLAPKQASFSPAG